MVSKDTNISPYWNPWDNLFYSFCILLFYVIIGLFVVVVFFQTICIGDVLISLYFRRQSGPGIRPATKRFIFGVESEGLMMNTNDEIFTQLFSCDRLIKKR